MFVKSEYWELIWRGSTASWDVYMCFCVGISMWVCMLQYSTDIPYLFYWRTILNGGLLGPEPTNSFQLTTRTKTLFVFKFIACQQFTIFVLHSIFFFSQYFCLFRYVVTCQWYVLKQFKEYFHIRQWICICSTSCSAELALSNNIEAKRTFPHTLGIDLNADIFLYSCNAFSITAKTKFK